MKKAIALVGNLRTFFMPMRDQSGFVFQNNLGSVLRNNGDADVFILTDTTDFYHEGYMWSSEPEITVVNNAAFNLYENIKIGDRETCRDIITNRIKQIIPNVTQVVVEDPCDVSGYEKTISLQKSGHFGSSKNYVAQSRKLKLGLMAHGVPWAPIFGF